MGSSVHDRYEPFRWHYPVPNVNTRACTPRSSSPQLSSPWKDVIYREGCLPQTDHRVSTATWVKVQAHVWALTQIQENFYTFSPLAPPSPPPGLGHSVAPASKHPIVRGWVRKLRAGKRQLERTFWDRGFSPQQSEGNTMGISTAV